ncbi:hypothetical protein N1851_018314 [Merluccius polli]|uniref:Paraneoplastic antigen Ma-like C-terminal domain-containing protein n=1 Tax=Merluccius polli TaxID=89951 RepID=A0AA47MP18_MERPO|nr:hypothetical protein N1851_018314 [Merluccius polli]
MEAELQELREVVAQLRADNERLRQEQVAAVPGPSTAPSISLTPAASSTASAPLTERLIFVPRDRKCPIFRGKSGIGLTEWLEEVQACMRARHLSASDQAFFLLDHLEGEAREEIKYRPSGERADPAKIIAVLQELYGCAESYVALQEAFFSRRQQEGETLLEFSLVLMGLMASVKQRAPSGIPNAEVLSRDQFVEHVLDGALRRELKQFVRRQPTATLLEVRSEAIRWEREGLPGVVRGRSHSVPSIFGAQCVVQGSSQGGVGSPQSSELPSFAGLSAKQAVPPCPGVGKLAPAELQSHSSGGAVTGSGCVGDVEVSKLMSSCPQLGVGMGGVAVSCLLDTGSMVSTIPESLFRQHFEPWGQERLKSCHWLQLRAANGLAIPYIGYLELDVELCGRRLPGCGILVVKDPPGCLSAQVPGVLGMNVIRKCYKELFGHHGLALFDLPVVSEAPKPVMQALQKCHQASVKPDQSAGKVKVRGKSACRIPGGVMKIVVATCSEQYSGSTVLFEPLDSGLPAGLLASPALVPVVRGTAYIPIVNEGGPVYTIAPRDDPTRARQVHRSLLKAVVGVDPPGSNGTSSPPAEQPQSEDELSCDGDLLFLRPEYPLATPHQAAAVTQTTPQLLLPPSNPAPSVPPFLVDPAPVEIGPSLPVEEVAVRRTTRSTAANGCGRAPYKRQAEGTVLASCLTDSWVTSLPDALYFRFHLVAGSFGCCCWLLTAVGMLLAARCSPPSARCSPLAVCCSMSAAGRPQVAERFALRRADRDHLTGM